MTDADATEVLRVEPLRTFGTAVYEACGVPADDAAFTVEIQLTADLRGVDTHGFQRLPWYAGHLREGRYNPTPSLATIHETPVSLVVDGDGGIGQLVVARTMARTITKARETGLALGTLRRSNDWGMGAFYPMMAAAEGFVSFCTTTSPPSLAPFGGRTRMTGNNPMAFAAPRASGPPMVLDMALTPVALGKVMRARAEGREIPEEWGFQDLEGQPTTDPETGMAGVIPALGAVSAYKGTGLSLFMNTLAGALPGGDHSADVAIGHRGQFLLVISPDLFGEADVFEAAIDEIWRQVKATEPLPGVAEVLAPGEQEQRTFEQRSASGEIAYPASTVRELMQLSEELGIPLDA